MKRTLKRSIVLAIVFVLVSCTARATVLQLSPEERAWLKEHKTIRISGPQAFPPFQYVDGDGTFKGMASDYVLHIAKLIGLEVEFVHGLPWSEILEKIERKEIDLLTCAAITRERADYLLYTQPHLSFPLIIVSRKDAPFISGLDSLHDKRIAVTRKNSTVEWLEKDKISAIPHFVGSPLEALQEVSRGKADVAIENLAAATYLIEKNGLTNLKIAAPTSYENYALAIAIRNDWPELASILNKGLASISDSKHNEIRQKWIAVRYEYGVSARDIFKWVFVVTGVSSAVLLIFFFWNRKLTREIVERKKAESEKEALIHELREALAEIKTLRGILPICSECKSIRDDKGYWTKLEAYLIDHSEADFSHSICPHCMEKLYGVKDWFHKDDNLGQNREGPMSVAEKAAKG
jgi:ABC-type amino acid transport substrate-binding protein